MLERFFLQVTKDASLIQPDVNKRDVFQKNWTNLTNLQFSPIRSPTILGTKCRFGKMVHFFFKLIPLIFMRYQIGILCHMQREFWKNINHGGHQVTSFQGSFSSPSALLSLVHPWAIERNSKFWIIPYWNITKWNSAVSELKSMLRCYYWT